MVVKALAPRAGFLMIGWGMAWKPVTLRVTGLVTPLMVSWPSMLLGLSPSNTTLVDLKVAVGNFAVSRKSSPCRWPLKSAKPVFTDFMSITMSTEPVLASASNTTLPVVLVKLLSWVEKPKCE